MSSNHLTTDLICSFLLDIENAACHQMNDLLDSAQARKATLHLHPVTVSECCNVLESEPHGISRYDIADALTRFIVLDGVRCADHDTVLDTLERYARQDMKFADAWVGVLSQAPLTTPTTTTDSTDRAYEQ